MREIKFRAWSKGLKEMFVNCDINHNGDVTFAWNPKEGSETQIESYAGTKYETDCIPMQYTGLKDCYGEDIYEGDVLRGEYEQVAGDFWFCGFVVEYRNGAFRCAEDVDVKISLGYRDGFVETADSQFDIIEESSLKRFDCEIIGNIYENPELLDKLNKLK